MLGMRLIPPLLKIALSILLDLILTPLVVAAGASTLPFSRFLLAIGQEVVLGLLLGYAVTLIFSAVQFAAAILGLQFGFSLANVIDPTLTGQETVVGQFYSVLTGLIFFTINGHHHVLAGLARSFEVAPPLGYALFDAAQGTTVERLLTLSATLFEASLRIAMPIMGALLLADVAMAVIARSAPQMNVYFVGLPIKILAGLVALMLALPLTVVAIERLMNGIMRDMLLLAGGG
jgi:flagellar biosynthetic protein FliR